MNRDLICWRWQRLWAISTIVACSGTTVRAPVAMSPPPAPSPARTLRAALAKIDITPPPGVGLMGNGPEGREARGYRLHLFARALVLEDMDGNREALVVVDLAHSGALLQRRVAAITATTDGIGADRLLISATHTHSGPSHYLDAAAYNTWGSSVPGFDEAILDTLAHRIARAIHRAAQDLRPARIAWGQTAIWGATRIRSLPAMIRNVPSPTPVLEPPAGLAREYQLVDPRLTLLRVDTVDHAGHAHPIGAFGIFAMHGTGNSPVNQLLDADVHGIIERLVERGIHELATGAPDSAFIPTMTFALANGAEGDVSPDWPPQSRCTPPTRTIVDVFQGPHLGEVSTWREPGAPAQEACIASARAAMSRVGDAVAAATLHLFAALADSLTSDIRLARSVVTLSLADDALALGICPDPATGLSTFGGADDAHTRVYERKILGMFEDGIEQNAESPSADPRPCHMEKRQVLGSVGNTLLVRSTLPRYAQLSAVQIGTMLLLAVPAEPTTTAGARMVASGVAGARQGGAAVSRGVLVGLTNGYIEYVATREEYTAQYYEGGSTLYGPNEADMLSRTLGSLASRLTRGDVLPATVAPELSLSVDAPARIVSRDSSHTGAKSNFDGIGCSNDTIVVDFHLDEPPEWAATDSEGLPSPRIEIFRGARGGPLELVARDDDPNLEMWLMGSRHGAARWEARWSRAQKGAYVIKLRGVRHTESIKCRYGILDLEGHGPDSVDANGLLLNPHWSDSTRSVNIGRQCRFFAAVGDQGYLGSGLVVGEPPCTDEASVISVNQPKTPRAAAIACNQQNDQNQLQGHVNFVPITLVGRLRWLDMQSKPAEDQDYNLKMLDTGLETTGNREHELELEFNGDETVRRMVDRQGIWDSVFRAAQVDSAPHPGMLRLLFGSEKSRHLAIVSGLLGLDGIHNFPTELHPVWAIAVQRSDSAGEATWFLFVRNLGNEGECASGLLPFAIEPESPDSFTYRFRIPWDVGADSVSLESAGTRLLTTTAGPPRPTFAVVRQHYFEIAFRVPKARQASDYTMIYGQVRLQWHYPPGMVAKGQAPADTSEAESREETREPGQLLQEQLGRKRGAPDKVMERLTQLRNQLSASYAAFPLDQPVLGDIPAARVVPLERMSGALDELNDLAAMREDICKYIGVKVVCEPSRFRIGIASGWVAPGGSLAANANGGVPLRLMLDLAAGQWSGRSIPLEFRLDLAWNRFRQSGGARADVSIFEQSVHWVYNATLAPHYPVLPFFTFGVGNYFKTSGGAHTDGVGADMGFGFKLWPWAQASPFVEGRTFIGQPSGMRFTPWNVGLTFAFAK